MNQWNSKIKRIDNEHTYGLSIVDFHYPETHHINIKGQMVSSLDLIL